MIIAGLVCIIILSEVSVPGILIPLIILAVSFTLTFVLYKFFTRKNVNNHDNLGC